jgi:hypothetical protein
VRARIVLVLVALGTLTGGCNALGGGVPGFCGVSDDVRLAIADVPPEQYPAEAGKHVQELENSAAELSGDQKELADKVVKQLSKAAETKPGSLEFGEAYNKFVKLSNRFNHKYCNETEPPDFG